MAAIITGEPIAHFRMAKKDNVTHLKVTFGPTQNGSGIPSPDNIMPIVGKTGITTIKSKKNLYNFNFENLSTVLNSNNEERAVYKTGLTNCSLFFSASAINSQSLTAGNINIVFVANGVITDTYEFIKPSDTITNRKIEVDSSHEIMLAYTNPNTTTFGIQLQKYNIQIEVSNAISQYEAYEGQSIITTLPDVFYGGYLDIITGQLVITNKFITLTGEESNASYNWNSYTINDESLYSPDNDKNRIIMCSHTKLLISGGNMHANYSTQIVCASLSLGGNLRYRDRNNMSDLATARAYVKAQYDAGTPIQFVVPLASPLTYQLSPQILELDKGINNIWSKDGTVEVQYPLTETKQITVIKQKIIKNQPHLKIVSSGNTADSATICHFKTDVAANIKQLIINFAPSQSGSGTPSPSNVRAISGYSNINVTRCGVNILQSHAAASGVNKNITYTVTRNNVNEVSSVSMSGTANADNAFRNLNYTKGKNNLFSGLIATNSFSSQANILAVTTNDYIYDVNDNWVGSMPSAGIQVFNIDKDLYSDGWFRIQAFPYKSSGVSYDTTVYPFISLYQDRNSVFEPYNGQTITITLPDTFYGGYLNLETGLLTITHESLKISQITGWGLHNNTSKRQAWKTFNIAIKPSSRSMLVNCISDMFNPVSFDATWEPWNISQAAGDMGEGILICVPSNTYSSGAEMAADLGDVTICYEMNTPQTYQLTPQTIKTLRGINNIWSDQGTVEVKYWTH